MPKKLKIGLALAADYVAEGLGNKYTIVNAITGNMKVPALPAQIGIGIIAEVIVQEGQGDKITLELLVGDQLVLALSATLASPPRVGEPATLHFPHIAFAVQKDSNLDLYLSTEGFQRTLAMRKRIFQDPDASGGNARI
jgi:hypothetical protein